MPWELTIARGDRMPLGEVSSVRAAVESALPGVQFFREPSGAEKMAAAGIEFPEILRQHLESAPPMTQADYEGADFSIRFFLSAGAVVDRMDAEVRGSGDSIPALRSLVASTGWIIQDASGQRVVPS